MNKKQFLIFNIALVFVLFASTNSLVVRAQEEKEEPLNLEWVKDDVDGVAVLMKLTPVEHQDIESLKKQLKGDWSIDDEELGFGGNRVRLSNGYGYSSIHIDVLTFRNVVAYYEIGVTGSSEKWNEYRELIINAWKQNGGPDFTEKGDQLTYQKRFESVFDSYYRAVGYELGEMKPVTVPAELKDGYEYLTSPLKNSYIGEGGCGYGGGVLEGKTAIDELIDANRIDLIENVLRGYNPGGRIFAAIALSRMRQKGLELSSEVTATLDKVVNLDVPAATCSGCIISSGRTAKSIVAEFLKK